jgi:hypothetical protein
MAGEERPEFIEPPDVPGAEGEGPKGALQETLKKALLAGVGALFMTEEGARRLAREWKLPRDIAAFVGQQAQGAKDEMLRVVSDEVRRFLESEAVRREFARALSSLVVEVKAEIRLRPEGEGGGAPEVKAQVKARRPGKRSG